MNRLENTLIALSKALNYVVKLLELYIADWKSGKNSENLSPIFSKAYDETLRQNSGIFVDAIVQMCLKAIPSRNKFHQYLLIDSHKNSITKPVENQLMEELKEYLAGVIGVQNRIRSMIMKINPKYKSEPPSPSFF